MVSEFCVGPFDFYFRILHCFSSGPFFTSRIACNRTIPELGLRHPERISGELWGATTGLQDLEQFEPQAEGYQRFSSYLERGLCARL
jgi:hypothetical protein